MIVHGVAGLYTDCLCVAWLTKAGRRLAADAKSCGFTGLVTLAGAMRKGSWAPKMWANYHPTYYGERALPHAACALFAGLTRIVACRDDGGVV